MFSCVQVSGKSAQSTAPRSAVDCKVQWVGWDHPHIKKSPWNSAELTKLTQAVAELRLPPEDAEDAPRGDENDGSDPNIRVDWTEVSLRLEVGLGLLYSQLFPLIYENPGKPNTVAVLESVVKVGTAFGIGN